MSVMENLKVINEKIEDACSRSDRNKNSVSIIAVTKYVSVETTKEAIQAGVKHIGENRDDGFLKKYEAIGSDPTWHYIGSLQTRKVKNVINQIDYLHSLDRISLAAEIQKRASKIVKCFIQVNTSQEESKQGVHPEQLLTFIEELKDYPSIEIVGLMTMAPFTDVEETIRNCFRDLRILRDKIQSLNLPYAPCHELSMGMSNDYEIAIEEGATYIRIGTSLVGNEL